MIGNIGCARVEPSRSYQEPFLLLRNERGRFVDVSAQAGEAFKAPRAGRGAAFADLNNDGAIDIVVSCLGQNAVLLQNNGRSGSHWLMIDAVGASSNRDGIGTKIRIVSESGSEQHGIISAAGSYLSSSDKRMHFGLGKDTTIKLVEIIWPSGKTQRIANVKADQILTVKEAQGQQAQELP